MITRLSNLRPGQRGVIERVSAGGTMTRRLLDLGFVPRTPVECLYRNPGGSLTAYRVDGGVMALRWTDARGIWIICPEE